jgi:hypothetical protein
MAFCTQCGTQLDQSAQFCSSCGAPTGLGGTRAPAPSAAKPNTSPTVKLLVIGLSALLVLVLAGGGSIVYFLYRGHQQVQQITQAAADPAALLGALQKSLPNNQPLPSAPNATSSAASTAPAAQGSANALDERHVSAADGQCALFTKEELTKVLGDEFTHADADATGCTYKGEAPRLIVRTESSWKGGHKLVKEKSDAYAGMRQSMLNQHYSRADSASHVFPISPFPGVGDEAWVDLVNIVTARKGDAGIVMDLRYYHDSDELTKMLTNTALLRLQPKDSAAAGASQPTP